MIKSVHMRSTASTAALVIQTSHAISDSEEEDGEAPQAKAPTKRFRPSAAHKIIIATPQGRCEPHTSLIVDPQSARKQAREAKLQSSNVKPSISPACMSLGKIRKESSTRATSSLPAGSTAVDEDSDQVPDLVTSSFDNEDDGIM
jgi:hypothetical protein